MLYVCVQCSVLSVGADFLHSDCIFVGSGKGHSHFVGQLGNAGQPSSI